MKFLRCSALLFVTCLSLTSNANLIQNGAFDTCDFTGWEKDTDGAGDVSIGNDFEIFDNGRVCSAAISVDYFETEGDPFSTPISEAYFANTLFQSLDFTGDDGSTFLLTIDVRALSEGDSGSALFVPDYFIIGLNDGQGNYYDETGNIGLLVEPIDVDGLFEDTFTFELDTSFVNQPGWFLDIQLNIGIDSLTFLPDALGTTLFVNSVEMVEVLSAEVPEPSSLVLILLGVLGAARLKKQFN